MHFLPESCGGPLFPQDCSSPLPSPLTILRLYQSLRRYRTLEINPITLHGRERGTPDLPENTATNTEGPPIFCTAEGCIVKVMYPLSSLSIPNKYPLPLTSDLLDESRGGKWFTSIDLKNEYNLIRIGTGHE